MAKPKPVRERDPNRELRNDPRVVTRRSPKNNRMVHKKKSPAMIYTHAIQPFVIVDRRTGKETPQGLRLTPIPDWRNQR